MESADTEQTLPTTKEELDRLVETATQAFNVPNCEETYEAIAAAIMHLPPNKATAPIAYFGAAAIRRLAQEVAYKELRAIDEKRKEAEEKRKARLNLVGTDAAPVSGEPVQNA